MTPLLPAWRSRTAAALFDLLDPIPYGLFVGTLVNGVAPGPVWTPLQPSGGQPQEKVQQFGAQAPMKRPGQPAELAPVYVLLASQESSFVTGEIYGVTGGNHLP